jgi:hypothetical protein
LVSAAENGTRFSTEEGPICELILSMGRVDVNPDVRDQARFVSGVVRLSIGLKHDVDALEIVPSLSSKLTLADARQIFLGLKPPASFLPVEDTVRTTSGVTNTFRFGTLSSLVGHRARSAYQPLPAWADENSPDFLRVPPEVKVERKDGWKVTGSASNNPTFYASESDHEHGPSSSSSESSSESGESSDDESDDVSEDSSSSDSESDTQQNGSVHQLIPMQQSQPPVHAMTKKASPTTRTLTSVRSKMSSDESSSASSSSSESSDDEEPVSKGSIVVGSLIPMGHTTYATAPKPAVNGSSVADDLRGLVLAPIVVDAADPTNPDFERDSSVWTQLVRPELASGLSVKVRFLRGVTKSKQAQLMGLTLEKPTVVCAQIRFENEKKDTGSFRRLRIVQRTPTQQTTGTTIIRPLQMVLPPEIAHLAAGRRSDCVVGIDFSAASDRDEAMIAYIDIKFGSGGGVKGEIKPTIGDLLLPARISVSDFDGTFGRLRGGFNRLERSFPAGPKSDESLLERILQVAALTPIGKDSADSSKNESRLRLAGTLPGSGVHVYVLVVSEPDQGRRITVCCDHALVVNSVMSLLKKCDI